MDLLLATRNEGKIDRFKKLLGATGLEVSVFTPRDKALRDIEVEEIGATLADNAELKVRAYFGRVDMPILGNDTGFLVEGEGLVEAPKRIAFVGREEETLTDREKAERMTAYWRGIATKHGGRVEAAWIEAFALLLPDGTLRRANSRRSVILTDQIFGTPHIHMPVRALYISQATGKPAIEHTPEEELCEMQPVSEARRILLRQ